MEKPGIYPYYVSEKRVSELFSIPIGTLRRHRNLGVGLPFVRFDRLVLYRVALVKAYLEAREIQTQGEVTTTTAELLRRVDDLAGFLEEHCTTGPGCSATAKELYAAYTSWSEDLGLREKITNPQTFGRCLTERGFRRDRGSGGVRLWRGLGLRSI